MKKCSKAGRSAIGCVIGSICLYGILTITNKPVQIVSEAGQIPRPPYGEEMRQVSVIVEGIGDKEIPITVDISAKEYREQEAKTVFDKIMETIEPGILNGNISLMEVRTDLSLPTQMESYGVRLRWYSSDPEVMDSRGKIQNSVHTFFTEEIQSIPIVLRVQLSDGVYKQEYEIELQVLPPLLTEEERQVKELINKINQKEEGQRTEDYLSLPMEYEGKTLHYRTEETSDYKILLVLGLLLAVLCYAKDQADTRQKQKNRERELLLDYAELLSKLMILLGAGMTVRGAWERMVKDYELGVTSGFQKRRVAYDEMGLTYYQLTSGLSEGQAYGDFGRRCGLQPYLKLSSLLEQNRKAGMKNLRGILQVEVNDAFEQRKNLARKLGEEAGTKLLLPLFLMLGIVMVMIMVPAMMTMG